MRRDAIAFPALLLVAVGAASCVVLPQRPSPLSPGDYAPVANYLSAYVESLMESNDVVGATILLVDDQRIAFAGGFGYADRAKGIAATPESVYTVASLTKLFTATAVMQLVEEGKVDLDAPVRTYVPEFQVRSRYPAQADITVRMLMTHHSGLPSDWGAGLFKKHPVSFRSIVGYLKTNYLSYPPNYILNYSNIGVDLLGLVIERASGVEYQDYVQRRIFAPLGMTSSWFPGAEEDSRSVSRSYVAGRETDEMKARDVPSNSLYSSGLDLARFAMAMHARGDAGGGRILEAPTVESMWVPQNEGVPMDLNRRIGLMWQLGRQKLDYSGRVVFHHGLSLYHRSTLVMLPDHRLTAIVLTNTDTGDRITERVADELLRVALEVKEGIRPPAKPVRPPPVSLSREQLEAYTGTFATLKGIARIALDGGRLRLTISGVKLLMEPAPDGFFTLRYRLLGIFPLSIRELEDARVTVRTFPSGRALVLEREGIASVVGEELDRRQELPPSWLRRVGRYELVAAEDDFPLLDDTLDLAVRDGVLTGRLTSDKFDIGSLDLILDPLDDREALIKGLGRSGRETLFVKGDDGEELLEYSGYLFRKAR